MMGILALALNPVGGGALWSAAQLTFPQFFPAELTFMHHGQW